MLKTFKITPFIITLLLAFPVSPLGNGFKITRVYDGDTVQAETPESVIYMMLVGIDAPEVSPRPDIGSQAFGREAKEFLSSLVLNKSVEVRGYGKADHPYNNIISVIYFKDRNINLEMVKHGLAEVQRDNLPPGFDIEAYLEAEREAKEAKRGMWSLGDKYMSPQNWRNTQRGR